ncbi:MAG: DsbA family protein [Lachnospiraceae bacterium]|jgi:predicted DsbA family dithiol-disulfide isomerase|nr:DsbA family protein [Lachnospiraceae bacterium]
MGKSTAALELFYDYSCPYCLMGYDLLVSLLPSAGPIDILWRPCEAHPRPEVYRHHSDLCARGFFFAVEAGVDPHAYHRLMFHAALKDRIDIDDPAAVARAVGSILDSAKLEQDLRSDRYVKELDENNTLAWDVCGFDAVPSIRWGDRLLGAVPGVGIGHDALAGFLKG